MNPQFLFNPDAEPFVQPSVKVVSGSLASVPPRAMLFRGRPDLRQAVCLLPKSTPRWSHEDVSGFLDGGLYTRSTSVLHVCQTQTPIITTELWGYGVCVWGRERDTESLCVCVCGRVVVALCGIVEGPVWFLFGIGPDV